MKLIYLNEEIESDSKGEKNKKMKGNKNTEKKDWLHVNEDLEGNFKSTTKIEQSTHEKSHRNESLCSTKQEMSAEHLPNIEMMRGNEKQVNDEMNSTLSLHESKNDNIKQCNNSTELPDIQHFSNQLGTQNSLNHLGNLTSLNQLGIQNPSLNHLGNQCHTGSPGNQDSLNHLGIKYSSLNHLGNQNPSLNHLGNQSCTCISGNQDSLNHLGIECSLNNLGISCSSLNHLGNQISLNELGNQNSLNELGNKCYRHSCNQNSLSGIGIKNSLNQLGGKIPSQYIENHNFLGELETQNPLNYLGRKTPAEKSDNHKSQNHIQNQSQRGHSENQNSLDQLETKFALNHLGQSKNTNTLNDLGIQSQSNTKGPSDHPRNQNCLNQLGNQNYSNQLGNNTSLNQLGNQTFLTQQGKELDNQNENSDSFSNSESMGSENTDDSKTEGEEYEEIYDPFRYFSDEFYTILYSNVDQSLTGKMNELLERVDRHKPNIIMLTEIEPKCKKDQTKQIKDSEISIPNYALFTNTNRKRGVAIYIESKLNPRECTRIINNNFEEGIFCEIEGANNEKILLGCMYKSPNSSKENVQNMIDTIKNDNLQKYDIICITGDFNYPKVKWNGMNTGDNEIFVESLKDAYLTQKVEYPTRNVRLDQQANIVDLVLINDENLIPNIIHCNPLGASDHDVLLFQINAPRKKKKKTTEKKFNLSKGNYKKFRAELKKEKWEEIETLGVEETWEQIKTKIIEGMNKYIPKSKIKDKQKSKPVWMNNKILRKIKKKYHAYKRYLVTKQGKEYEMYIKRRNECSKAIKRAKRKHESNIANESKENPTKFWKYVNEKCKTNVGISSLKDEKGNLVTSDEGRANILNKFFTSVFLKEDTSNLPNVKEGEFSNNKNIGKIKITEQEVEKKLKKLNPQKAQGPDQIPPRVLKEISKEISKPLSMLFNKSLESGEIPKEWKFAEVTAIFKKGNKTDPGNYRPVSLTCICCKIMEQFVRDEIVNHMSENELYSKCQHGFRKHRSCITQLIEVYDKLTELIDDGKNIDVVYLDFKKAFDSIPHERLLLKMKGYGITGQTLNWVRAFLSGRNQRVKIGSSYSSRSEVTSGIPQGSILGPVLFTIFINDLPEALNVHCKVFADDTKIYDDVRNSKEIQRDLYRMQEWTEKWNLYFNVSKCKVMHIGKNNPKTKYFMKIENENQKIDTCKEEKDLGITFDENLNFDLHINNITKKANQMLGVIRRTFDFISKNIFSKLYKSLVRSHLEYGNVIWSPYLKRQSIQIERVQRRATKLVPECKDMSYTQRLKYLKLYSLKGRRLRGDLIQTYKIFQNLDEIDKEIMPLSTYTSTRNQGDKMRRRYSKTNIRKFTFTNRVVDHWNTLPPEVKNSPTLNTFKNRLDKNPKLLEKFYEYDES